MLTCPFPRTQVVLGCDVHMAGRVWSGAAKKTTRIPVSRLAILWRDPYHSYVLQAFN